MMWRLGRYGSVLVLLVAVMACGQPAATGSTSGGVQPGTTAIPVGTPESHDGPVADQVSLIDHLRGKGLTVETAGNVQQPFFTAQGTLLRISGGELTQPADVQVFDYETAEAAKADVRQIGPDGSPRTMMITWVAPPHFFHRERVVVLYTGTDPAVLTLLAEVLGPQFAGA